MLCIIDKWSLNTETGVNPEELFCVSPKQTEYTHYYSSIFLQQFSDHKFIKGMAYIY